MTESPNLTRIAQNAEQLLRQEFGQTLRLTEPRLLKDKTRSLIVRCTVQAAPADATLPATVIIKQMNTDIARGFSDWASLAYLATLPAVGGLVPRFLAGDASERFFVMTDLGGSASLEDLLQQSAPEPALAALRALAVTMARLSGATLSGEEGFTAIRSALPGADGLGRQAEAEQWRRKQAKIVDWWAAANCPLPAGFLAGLEQIAAVYAEPEPFLSFSHGDPAPTNNHIGAGQVNLLDFEYGGFRHALYDITGWNILCPLPRVCVQAMNAVFRQELARTCAAAADQRAYAEAWAALCAFRALALLTWIPPATLAANRPWVDERWTSRHAVYAALARLQAATLDSVTLASVGEAAGRLLKVLRQQWPELADAEDVATEWPALAGL